MENDEWKLKIFSESLTYRYTFLVLFQPVCAATVSFVIYNDHWRIFRKTVSKGNQFVEKSVFCKFFSSVMAITSSEERDQECPGVTTKHRQRRVVVPLPGSMLATKERKRGRMRSWLRRTLPTQKILSMRWVLKKWTNFIANSRRNFLSNLAQMPQLFKEEENCEVWNFLL